MEKQSVRVAQQVSRTRKRILIASTPILTLPECPFEDFVKTKIAAHVHRIEDLNKRIVRHAGFSHTDVSDQQLRMSLELFVVKYSGRNKQEPHR